jgi:RNA polymerase sigma factor (sigma-70 family)
VRQGIGRQGEEKNRYILSRPARAGITRPPPDHASEDRTWVRPAGTGRFRASSTRTTRPCTATLTVRNAYLHRARADRHHREVPLEWADGVGRDDPDPYPEIDPQRLQAALNEIPEAFRTPLILFYFEEFSYRDIAEQMDLPIGTVMSRLARAKAQLRQRLAPGPNGRSR